MNNQWMSMQWSANEFPCFMECSSCSTTMSVDGHTDIRVLIATLSDLTRYSQLIIPSVMELSAFHSQVLEAGHMGVM